MPCSRAGSICRPRATRPVSSRSRIARPISRDSRRRCARPWRRPNEGGAMKAARVFQLTALLLVAVSVVQAGWWLLDQRGYTIEKVRAARAAYAGQTAAAQALL